MFTFVCLFQLSEDGVADYDTIIGMLPDVIADRGGKMISKCRHVREYRARSVFRAESDIFTTIFPLRKLKIFFRFLNTLDF
jgi:hypothetical protein